MKLEDKNMSNKENKTPKAPGLNETGGFHFEGHIKIFDPETGEVYQDKRNAIHYENMSVAIVNSLQIKGKVQSTKWRLVAVVPQLTLQD